MGFTTTGAWKWKLPIFIWSVIRHPYISFRHIHVQGDHWTRKMQPTIGPKMTGMSTQSCLFWYRWSRGSLEVTKRLPGDFSLKSPHVLESWKLWLIQQGSLNGTHCFWVDSNLMQIYGSFEGFFLNSVLVGNILTPVCCNVVWPKKRVHWIWKCAHEKK